MCIMTAVPVAVLVAESSVGGDHGGQAVAVGMGGIGVTGTDRPPVSGSDLGATGTGGHAEHRVGIGLVSTHGPLRWLIAV